MHRLGLIAIPLLLACRPPGETPEGRGTACGIVAVAGPTLLLEQFTRPGQTLSQAPPSPPASLPVRLAAGAAFRAVVSLGADGWLVGVEGTLPPTPVPEFGVLVVDRASGPRGVVLYEGDPIRGAPVIGSIATLHATLPLLGLELNFQEFDVPACPFFPDSLRR